MKTYRIRPFNAISALFLILSLVFPALILFFVIDMLSGATVPDMTSIIGIILFSFFVIWLETIFLSIVFSPYIDINEDFIEIHHWKNGTPYDKKHPLRRPRTIKTTIPMDELAMYGAYLLKDIENYTKKGSGFIYDQWMVVTSTPIPLPLKFPSLTKNLRDLLLFVKSDGESVVVDGGQYGLRQVQYLLHVIKQHTDTKASGRVSPKKRINSFALNVIKAFAVVCWLTVLPISTIWLEGLINPLHIPSYQSVWRTVFVISILLANLSMTGYWAIRRQRDDIEMPHIKTGLLLIALVLYVVFVVTLIVSAVL